VSLKEMFLMHKNVRLFFDTQSFSFFFVLFLHISFFTFLLPEAALTLAFKASRSRLLLAFFWLGLASSFPESSLGGLNDLLRLASRLIADSA
jgi:hypothetical protein